MSIRKTKKENKKKKQAFTACGLTQKEAKEEKVCQAGKWGICLPLEMEEKMKKPVLLVVEDVRVYARMAEDIFKEEYEVIQANGGREAIELMKSGKPIDMVLLDLFMPDVDGFQVMEWMKKQEKLCSIPVIVNTTEGNEKNVLRALDLGAIDFVTKPYNPEVMKRIIKNVLNKVVVEQNLLKDSIREQKFQWQNFTESMPGGVATYEIGERIRLLYSNEMCAKILGLTKEEFFERCKDDVLKMVHPEDVGQVKKKIRKAIREKEFVDMTFRVLRDDGSQRYLRVYTQPYQHEDKVLSNAILMDITNEKEATEQLEKTAEALRFQARHDALTGIYNQTAFCEETTKMLKEHPDMEFVLVHVDIDHFKVVNDLLGVQRADRLLQNMALSLKLLVENMECATFCRRNGDRFALCYPKKNLKFEALKDHVTLREENISFPYHVGFTYGIYPIKDAEESVLRMCDRAALAGESVKYSEKDYYAVYDDEMREQMIREQRITSEMRSALLKGQFQVYLQPIYSAANDTVVSAEALVRWIHPERGMVSPGEFIPLFEKNGFIVELDLFVRREVMKLIKDRLDRGEPMVPVSVNVSRVNFYNENFCDELIQDIESRGIPHDMIKFEITESTCTKNPERVLNVVDRLQSNHIKVLMDDFGSGYSSLNMLKEVPIDILKIDMGFLQDIEKSCRAASIVGSVIDMSKKLNIDVIAEGVETEGQKEILMENGCDNIQGYYYSKPLPIQEFLKLL